MHKIFTQNTRTIFDFSKALQVRNPDGRPDVHRRWWGFEGGTSMLAANFSVPAADLAGLRTQPRLGNADALDLFVDMPQPLACLTVRFPSLFFHQSHGDGVALDANL